MTTKLFYIDDSGSHDTGTIVFGWAEIDIASWNPAMRTWLDFRERLYRDDGIPADYELHATKFIPGRGTPTGNPTWDGRKAHRARVARAALDTIAAMPSAHASAVHRTTAKTGTAYHREKTAVYQDLLRTLDRRLGAAGDTGLIVMDGNGTDPSYRRAHRRLDLRTRNIVEDPFFAASHTSQLIQAADLIAYTAYQHMLQHPGKKFMWNWWTDHLPRAAPPAPI